MNKQAEGLCQNCKEWVFPENGFCPICGQEFIDIKEKDYDGQDKG